MAVHSSRMIDYVAMINEKIKILLPLPGNTQPTAVDDMTNAKSNPLHSILLT
jgi:hypothetical protein